MSGVVADRGRADVRCWTKWQEFCSSLGVTPFLGTLHDPIPLLQVFARRVRIGVLAHNGGKVRSRTAEAYLRAVGQTFARLGLGDPRLDIHGNIDFRIQRQLRSYKRTDPPPTRVKPIPIGLLHHLFEEQLRLNTPKSCCLAWMSYIAVFFLMRPGEHCDSGTTSHPFRWCDTQLHSGLQRLDVIHAPDATLRAASFTALTFTTQKSGVSGEVIGHGRSGASHACPVRAVAERIIALRQAGAPSNAPLATYRDATGLHVLTATDFTWALRLTAAVHGAAFGVTPADVSAGCFRTTGAMALFCGNVDSTRIRLVGRWQSWAMLRYLHLQSRTATQGLSAAMLRGGRFDLLASRQLPEIIPEAPDAPPAVVPNPQDDFEAI